MSKKLMKRGQDLLGAWKHTPVKLGMLGTALLFLGSLTPAYLPQTSPWWELLRALGWEGPFGQIIGTAMVAAAVALLIYSWFKLRPSSGIRVKYWAVGTLWALPMLFSPPIFSHDAYGYAAEGWLLYNELNPYDFAVSTQPGPFADQVAWLWRYDTAMYPPLSLRIFEGLVVLGGLNPYYSTLMMRLPAVLGVCLVAYFLPRIATRLGVNARLTAWFALLNPLLLTDLVGGAHNDALMLGLVVMALWLAISAPDWLPLRRLPGWLRVVVCFGIPPLIIGVAACVKQPALLAAVALPLIGRRWLTLSLRETLRSLARIGLSLVLAGGAFAAVTFACGLGFGWIKAVNVPGKVLTLSPLSWLGNGLKNGLALLGQPEAGEVALTVVQAAGLLCFVTLSVWLGLRVGRTKPITWLSWSYLIFAITGLAMHPWYLTWGGLLLPLTKLSESTLRTAIIVTTSLLAYSAGNLAWRNEALPLGFAMLAIVAVLLYRYLFSSENESFLAESNRFG